MGLSLLSLKQVFLHAIGVAEMKNKELNKNRMLGQGKNLSAIALSYYKTRQRGTNCSRVHLEAQVPWQSTANTS